MHIGLLCAMPEEIGLTIEHISNLSEICYGDLKIFSGEWHEENSNKPSLFGSSPIHSISVSTAFSASSTVTFFFTSSLLKALVIDEYEDITFNPFGILY